MATDWVQESGWVYCLHRHRLHMPKEPDQARAPKPERLENPSAFPEHPQGLYRSECSRNPQLRSHPVVIIDADSRLIILEFESCQGGK